ncbi:MAG: hypothetical protein RL572_674 [Pseudomonadota bacterium]|jgi:flagellar hook-associated protein 2
MATIDKTTPQTTQILKTLEMGSGVDVQGLAKSLAEAESAARIKTLTERKSIAERSVSGYGIVASFLGELKNSFDALKDASKLTSRSVTSGDPTLLAATVTGSPTPGRYAMTVQQLAGSTSLSSSAAAASDTSLNGGAALSLDFSFADGSSETVSVAALSDTPAGIVAAINAADIGVDALLVNKSASGNDWYIVLQGQTGSANDFSVTSTVAGNLGFSAAGARLSTAQDAILTVNGMSDVRRSSNRVTDLVPGVTLDLKSAQAQSISVVVESSNDPLREALQRLVDSYNELGTVLTELTRLPDEDSEDYTGSLRRDMPFVNSLRAQLRDMLTQTSSTPDNGITGLRNLGLSFNLDGTAVLDAAQLETALAADADAVVVMLSAGTDNVSDYSTEAKGLAQDVSILLKTMLEPSGILQKRKDSGNTRIQQHEKDLEALETRMEAVYQRYLKQFASMESLVERMQGVGNYLKGQFTAMENMYKQ